MRALSDRYTLSLAGFAVAGAFAALVPDPALAAEAAATAAVSAAPSSEPSSTPAAAPPAAAAHPEEAVGFEISAAPQVARGGRSEFAFVLHVSEGYAVLSHQLREPGLQAAKVELRGVKSVTIGPPRFPKGRLFKVGTKRLNAYEGELEVRIPLSVSRNLAPGLRQLTGSLTFQVCTATGCYAPVRRPLALQFEVTE